MTLFYNISVLLYRFVIGIAAFTGNAKAKRWESGRKNIFIQIRNVLQPGERRAWFHCASLGEFEQGRPVIEHFRKRLPEFKIVLTFFSPSGYEIRKNYAGADYVFYLPVDTRTNAEKFISLINPEKVFFVKYEYWFHYFVELGRRKIPNYIVSSIFRADQRFFKWYGGFFRKMLNQVSHFFLQDDQSAKLLKSIGLTNCTVTGDTRFDRVVEVASNSKPIPLVEKFKAGNKIFIAGSTWEKDEQLIRAVASELRLQNVKLIIAPHEVNSKKIANLLNMFSEFSVTKFSEANEKNISTAEVLIIDNIGMLSSLYRYGGFAYIGGGFHRGIHNILEAAVFGMPVFFGPNYQKFKEAKELIDLGGAFSVASKEELIRAVKQILNDESKRSEASESARKYVDSRKGATEKILDFIAVS